MGNPEVALLVRSNAINMSRAVSSLHIEEKFRPRPFSMAERPGTAFSTATGASQRPAWPFTARAATTTPGIFSNRQFPMFKGRDAPWAAAPHTGRKGNTKAKSRPESRQRPFTAMATYNDRSASKDDASDSDDEISENDLQPEGGMPSNRSDGTKTAASRVTCNFDLHPPSSRPSTAAPAPPKPTGREPSPRVPRLPLGNFNESARPASVTGFATDRPRTSASVRIAAPTSGGATSRPVSSRAGASSIPAETVNLDEKFNDLKNRMSTLKNRNEMLQGPTQINDMWNELVDISHVFQMERKHLDRQVKALQNALMISESKRSGADDKTLSSHRLQQEQFAFVKQLRHPYDLEKKCRAISQDIRENEKYLKTPHCRAEFTSRPSQDCSAEAVFVHLLEQRMRLTDDLVFVLKKRLHKYEENETMAETIAKHGSVDDLLKKTKEQAEEIKALKDANRAFEQESILRTRNLQDMSRTALTTMTMALQRELRVCYSILEKSNYTRNPHLKWLAVKKVIPDVVPQNFDEVHHFDEMFSISDDSSAEENVSSGMSDLENLTEKNMNLRHENRKLQETINLLTQERRVRDKSTRIFENLMIEISQRKEEKGFLSQKEQKLNELSKHLDDLHEAHTEAVNHLEAVQHSNRLLEDINQEMVHKKEALLRNTLLLSHKLLKEKETTNNLRQINTKNRSRLSGFTRLTLSLIRSLTIISGAPQSLKAKHHYAEYMYRDFFAAYLHMTSSATKIQAWYRRLASKDRVRVQFGKTFTQGELVRNSINPPAMDHGQPLRHESRMEKVESESEKGGNAVQEEDSLDGREVKDTVSNLPTKDMGDSIPHSLQTTGSSMRPSAGNEVDVADTLVPYRAELESLFQIAGLTYPRTEVEWVDCIKRLAVVRIQNESMGLDRISQYALVEKYLRQCDESENQRLKALLRRHTQSDQPALPTLQWHVKNTVGNVTDIHLKRVEEYERRRRDPPRIPRSLFTYMRDSIVHGSDNSDTLPALKKMMNVTQVLRHEMRTVLVPFVQARFDEFKSDMKLLALEAAKLQEGNKTYWRSGGVQATKGSETTEVQTQPSTRSRKVMAGDSMFDQTPPDKKDAPAPAGKKKK